MTLVGVDLHTREQSVALLDTGTGDMQELRLRHDGDGVERFYAALQRPVTVAIESTGYALWFHALMQRLGHTRVVGDAAKIRATVIRRTKTDRRDARHIVTLLREDRFPAIWVPDPEVRDLRALVAHRMRLVRVRTMVRNGVHAIALNYRLTLGASLFTRRGVAQLQELSLPTHTAHRRKESFDLLTWLDARIAVLVCPPTKPLPMQGRRREPLVECRQRTALVRARTWRSTSRRGRCCPEADWKRARRGCR